jgi:hypothetical protein
MKLSQATTLSRFSSALLLGYSLVVPLLSVQAQVVGFDLSRQKWQIQISTNGVPVGNRYAADVVGVGLQQAWVLSPAVSNALTGGTYSMSYATNITAVTITSTNIDYDTNRFNEFHPLGSYVFRADYNSLFARSSTYNINFTNDFPEVSPTLTDPDPSKQLHAVQTFSWPGFSQTSGDYCRFVVLEGSNIATNLLQEIMGL